MKLEKSDERDKLFILFVLSFFGMTKRFILLLPELLIDSVTLLLSCSIPSSTLDMMADVIKMVNTSFTTFCRHANLVTCEACPCLQTLHLHL